MRLLENKVMSETKNDWLINGLLAVILALLIGFYLHVASSTAYAAGGGWDTNGLMAITATEGEDLILVNTDPNDKAAGQTIMIYRTQGAGKFRLIGARSFKYDLELIDSAGTPQTEQRYQQGMTFREVYEDYQNKDKKP
jgi:hypothetical protein